MTDKVNKNTSFYVKGVQMRIVVAGIGGVGGYIGAHLCQLEDEVIFLVRGGHAQQIRDHGILIQEDHRSWYAYPDDVVTAQELQGDIDILLVCVKSYDITSLLQILVKNITPKTIIVPFSNGVEHKEKIESIVEAKVLYGALYILAHKEEDGVIVKKGKVFAAVFGSQTLCDETAVIASLFEQVGLRYKTPSTIEEAIWKKYLFISAFGSLTTYFDMGMKKVYEFHQSEAKQLLSEIAEVAKAKGIEIEPEVGKALSVAAGLPEDASSSMHLDFKNNRPTELETLSGYIVKEAKRLNVATPLMSKLYAVLRDKA